eukprot:CAMPEP_0167797408 /NCGR_PEP_ID=MMETSP0111_2-20121227/15638_1 /TAXON_ID=91324 /ORGANISM="Lotharella globosa, Strain CCCM811" /LENGTH=38 /DNA_ID= /DNA_START= /DNA_END= /DNA_ORIENTATION=
MGSACTLATDPQGFRVGRTGLLAGADAAAAAAAAAGAA